MARGEGPRGRGDRLAGVTQVVVDGRNVQFALRRGSAGPLPEVALVSRLRASLSGLDVRLVLDGHPAGGPQGRIAPGFRVEYGRHRSADAVIGELVVEAARELGPAGADTVLVVTNDREVRNHARRHGVRVEGSGWLVARLDRVAQGGPGGLGPGGSRGRPGTSIGHARPPATGARPRSKPDR